MTILFSLQWEFVFAIIVIVCATAALIAGAISQDLWFQVLTVIVAFLGGAGYGIVRTLGTRARDE